MTTCYMCENEATSDEHAPPKCLFPRQRDLPDGIDLRQNLITVPSCDAHNQETSVDDEYLLYTLVINIVSNDIAQNHFFGAILRGIQRNPALIERYTNTAVPVITEDTLTGEVASSFAVQIEYDRFKNSIDKLVRAIHFNHFGEKLLSEFSIQPEFMLLSMNPEHREQNDRIQELARASDIAFQDSEFMGDNPEVFKYQVLTDDQGRRFMRLYFYENAKVTIIL